MLGGPGNDRYAYVNPAEGFDSIFDFDTGSDKFQFTAANFGKNPGDTLTNGVDFIAGGAPAPAAATPAWLYSTGTGILTFDQDGIGLAVANPIAQIFLAPVVAASDIYLV